MACNAAREGKAKGYSLWLMPPGGLRRKLAKTIRRLAEECKGPVFEPHVTLVGGIEKSEKEMVRKTAELAGKIRQFKITLDRTEGTGHYFRCLFARAFETSELMVTNHKAREAFGKKKRARIQTPSEPVLREACSQSKRRNRRQVQFFRRKVRSEKNTPHAYQRRDKRLA